MTQRDPSTHVEGLVVRAKLVRARRAHGRIEFEVPQVAANPLPEPVRKPARVAQMLALAHLIERSIEAGIYTDRAQAARSLGLTRARVTQLSDLLVLAPDIQEELLSLESSDGVEPTTERAVRPITRLLSWRDQRVRWAQLDVRRQTMEATSEDR